MQALPSAFSNFRDRVEEILRTHLNPSGLRERGGHFRVLPLSVRQLAERAEATEDFARLASTLIPTLKHPSYPVSEALRRSGFYHGILADNPTETLWDAVEPHLADRDTDIRELLLLDGCWFPMTKFSVLDWTVERFTPDEITALGPSKEVSEVFYPREFLNPNWFSKQWFLHRRKTKKVSRELTSPYWHWPLDGNWKPLFALSLYNSTCFGIPVVIESEHRWKLQHVLSGEPTVDYGSDPDGKAVEIPVYVYEVHKESRKRFEAFLDFFHSTETVLENSKIIRPAARRYIRGMVITYSDRDMDVAEEEAFLQYIYALEKLLLGSGEKEGITDKIAIRCAYLIGLSNDALRRKTFDDVKRLYNERSNLVHGASGLSEKVELNEVRDLVRRVFVATLAFFAGVNSIEVSPRLCRGTLGV